MRPLIYSILLSIMAALPSQAYAQDTKEAADTLIATEKARKVTVTKTGDGVKVVVTGYGETQSVDYSYTSTSSALNDSTDSGLWNLKLLKAPSGNSKWSVVGMERIYIGGTIDTDGPVDMAFWRSLDIGVLNVIGVEYAPWHMGPRFSIGAGLGYRRVSTHKDTGKVFFRDAEGNISLIDSPENTTGQLSDIDIFHLDIPLYITQPLSKHWAISLGATLNFNTYLTGATKYKVLGENEFGLSAGHKVEESYKHLHQRPVTVDFTASIGYLDGVAFYARYSPMPAFKDGAGPKFKTLSLGIMFAF